MRKYFICFIILLFFCLQGFTQWNLKYYSSGNVFYAKSADTIITAAGGGRVNISYDGGTHWNIIETGIFEDCWAEDIHFPTSSVGYICGGSHFGLYKQFIIKTTDGGVTWDSLAADAWGGFGVNSLWFVNADTGYVSAGLNSLWKTTDGGLTYIAVPLPAFTWVKDIFFIDEQTGFLSTSQTLTSGEYVYGIMKTTDGGDSWNAVYRDTMNNATGLHHRIVNEIKFIDDSIGFAVGGNGLFLKSVDGGDSWVAGFIQPGSDLTTVDFINSSTGYINNAGSIFKTIDGGASWEVQNVSPVAIISKIDMINDTLGYAFSGDAVYKTFNGGGVVASVQKFSLKSQFRIYPNPANDFIHIEYDDAIKIQNVQLIDISGKTIKRFNNNEKVLNVSGLASGIYILNIQAEEGSVSERIIIE